MPRLHSLLGPEGRIFQLRGGSGKPWLSQNSFLYFKCLEGVYTSLNHSSHFVVTCMKHLQVPIESCQDSYVVDDNGNGMH